MACRALARAGLRVLAQNVYTASGEVDVLCRRGRTLVAVEVKSSYAHPAPERRLAPKQLDRVEAVIVVHSRERDDLRGEVAKLQQAWEAESAGLRASLRGAEAQVKSHADDARAAAATHDALLGSSSGSVSSPP